MSALRMGRLPVAGVVVAGCFGLGLLGAGNALAETVTFKATGKEQAFTVPAGVGSVHVVAIGGGGGVGASFGGSPGGAGGLGAIVSSNLGVQAGETLYVEVGGNGHAGEGAEEGEGEEGGGGGGGASDVRTVSIGAEPSPGSKASLESRLLVAGGGGGGGVGDCLSGSGGAGGNVGDEGDEGFGCAAFGGSGGAGTSTKGGAGGTSSQNKAGEEGALGAGGRGSQSGGGGGGGLYGGGGGGEGFAGGGGGGGSNLLPPGGEEKLAMAKEQPSVSITYEACKSAAATFEGKGQEQCYQVPAGVTTVSVTAVGSGGASAEGGLAKDNSVGGGPGAIVSGHLAVKPGEVLYVEVGGVTSQGGFCFPVVCSGFNGGGSSEFGAGGGASDVRSVSIGADPSPGNGASLESRLLVAAGGGGGGLSEEDHKPCQGGAGGGAEENGANGTNCGFVPGEGGGAGKAGGGGAGGADGESEALEAQGGELGSGGSADLGGGGGGGLYGGGGGGTQGVVDTSPERLSGNGGGGGGSNLVPAGGAAGLATAGQASSVTIAPVPVQPTSVPPPPPASPGGVLGFQAPGGPTRAQIAKALAEHLIPSGKRAKIAAVLKGNVYAVSFRALEAGKAVIDWYQVPAGAHLAAKKPVLIATGKLAFSKAGIGEIEVKLTSAGKSILKHVKQLKLTAKGIFTPPGSTPITALRTFTLRR